MGGVAGSMSTRSDDEDTTVEAQTLPTSLDPYGQLIKLLLPRALSIAIFDAMAIPLWLSDACEETDLLPLVEEALTAARANATPPDEVNGFGTAINGDPAYIFLLRDLEHGLLGAVAIACRDPGNSASRPFSFTHGLMRPALEVLTRELANQYSIGDLRRTLQDRDGDLQLLADANDDERTDAEEFEKLVQDCVGHLHCSIGSLLIPEKDINLACSLDGQLSEADAEFLERMQRHLLALTQVQRRTVTLNKAPGNAAPYKVLACPIIHGGQQVAGIMLLCKPRTESDFDLRQTRIVELLSRRIEHVLQREDLATAEPVHVEAAATPSQVAPVAREVAKAPPMKEAASRRVEVHEDDEQTNKHRVEDETLISTVREALANDRFRLEAQPIVPFGGGGETRRFELLLRMIDLQGDNIAPEKFFSAAERHRVATGIDRWVVQFVLEILSSVAGPLEKQGAHFAINLSGQSLGDEDFPVFLEQKLREYALPPSLLSFELTETAAVANIARAEMLIRRLQDLGHGIALDDFGRGPSSLTHLKSLSVSHLKIDGGLVRDLAGNQRTQATVNAIVQLARAMNLETTAECVETEAIHRAVAQVGVDFGQGFAIGRPRPLELVLQEVLKGAPGMSRASGSPLMSRLVG